MDFDQASFNYAFNRKIWKIDNIINTMEITFPISKYQYRSEISHELYVYVKGLLFECTKSRKYDIIDIKLSYDEDVGITCCQCKIESLFSSFIINFSDILINKIQKFLNQIKTDLEKNQIGVCDKYGVVNFKDYYDKYEITIVIPELFKCLEKTCLGYIDLNKIPGTELSIDKTINKKGNIIIEVKLVNLI